MQSYPGSQSSDNRQSYILGNVLNGHLKSGQRWSPRIRPMAHKSSDRSFKGCRTRFHPSKSDWQSWPESVKSQGFGDRVPKHGNAIFPWQKPRGQSGSYAAISLAGFSVTTHGRIGAIPEGNVFRGYPPHEGTFSTPSIGSLLRMAGLFRPLFAWSKQGPKSLFRPLPRESGYERDRSSPRRTLTSLQR